MEDYVKMSFRFTKRSSGAQLVQRRSQLYSRFFPTLKASYGNNSGP